MRLPIRNIMCGLDFSEYSNYSLRYGIGLAKELQAKLHICHVIDLTAAVIYGNGLGETLIQDRHLFEYSRQYMQELLKDCPVPWDPIITVGHPADEMARVAQEKAIDLAITATHGRSGLKRLILGSVTERLMRVLPCPLLAVRGNYEEATWASGEPPRLKKILVGCDFSPYSDLAFRHALSLAQEFEGELHLVHVIEPPTYKDLTKTVNWEKGKTDKDLRILLKDTLDKMVPEDAKAWCKHKTVLLAGFAHEEITKYAFVEKMDLIVLGVRGQDLVEKLLVGSTTDRVIREAHCPVLSVRPTAGQEAA